MPRRSVAPSATAPFLLGVVLLAALLVTIAQFGELARFLVLIRQVNPAWLGACLLAQLATYACEALAWRQALRAHRMPLPLAGLLRLSVAKLFSDQALPSAGVSGSVFFVAALRRRGIDPAATLSCMLAALAGHFSAYAALSAASALVLASHHELSRWLLVLASVSMVLQLGVPLVIGHLRRHGRLPDSKWLLRIPGLRAWAGLSGSRLPPLPAGLLPRLAAAHGAIMLLDCGTLWLTLRAIGTDVPFALVFASFMTASMVMSLSPIPLGLGSFEASCVAMLHAAGAGLEAALAATLLLRGMTTWLPMLPGVWLIRNELKDRTRLAC